MDLFEYQGKQYFAKYNIPVSAGGVALTVDEAVAEAEKAQYPVVVKAQVQVGGRGKAGGIGRRHALGDHERPHTFWAAGFAHDVMGLEERLGRRPTRAHDQTRAFVRDIGRFQPRICHRLRHGDKVIGRAIAHKTQIALIDVIFQHDIGLAVNARAKAVFGIIGRKDDAGFARAQRSLDLGDRVANRGNDAKTSDYNATHGALPSCFLLSKG